MILTSKINEELELIQIILDDAELTDSEKLATIQTVVSRLIKINK